MNGGFARRARQSPSRYINTHRYDDWAGCFLVSHLRLRLRCCFLWSQGLFLASRLCQNGYVQQSLDCCLVCCTNCCSRTHCTHSFLFLKLLKTNYWSESSSRSAPAPTRPWLWDFMANMWRACARDSKHWKTKRPLSRNSLDACIRAHSLITADALQPRNKRM